MKNKFKTSYFIMEKFIKNIIKEGGTSELIEVLKEIKGIEITENKISIIINGRQQEEIVLKNILLIRKIILKSEMNLWFLFINKKPIFYLDKFYDREFYSPLGFNSKENSIETGTKYNYKGFNCYGKNEITGTLYNKEGYNIFGFNNKGIHQYTGTKYDEFGYNKLSFNKKGFYKFTGTKYDLAGLDINGNNLKN